MRIMRRAFAWALTVAILLVCIPFNAPVVSAEPDTTNETSTYFYDRIGAQAQWCYNYLKVFYDSYENLESGTRRIRFYSLDSLPENVNIELLSYDFMAADAAIRADNPLYDLKGFMSGFSEGPGTEDDGRSWLFQIEFHTPDLLTDDALQRAETRIAQIVAAVRSADRYTTLRKLSDYLINNTFYDPYLDPINTGADHSIITGAGYSYDLEGRGSMYNTMSYGLLLENIAICSGFSQAVKLLCDALDIPCIIVGNNGHAWNQVQMEDGNWYRLDITNACRLGWDGQLPNTIEHYFEYTFLNDNALSVGWYDDPYMINANGIKYVTEFPELADGRYTYTGSTTDFSYTVADSSYVPCQPTFSYRVNKDKKTCTITNYEGPESGDLIIPEKIDGYTVTAIAAYAFYYRSGFTGKLVIPDTVEVIDNAAFAGCYGLTSVNLPAKLYKIGKGAFIGCKGLTEVVLPDLVAEITEYAFYDCTGLQSVTFGSHIQKIGDWAFEKLSSGAVMKGPANSTAQQYASANGIAFQNNGVLCDFRDADGNWEFGDCEHFHTCQHGGRFDYGAHINAQGGLLLNCGDKCEVCLAEYCWHNGAMESALTLVDEKPATCILPAYSGDWQCACGRIVEDGQWVGEPTGKHTPANADWEYDAHCHYQLCDCGERIGYESHSGGTATATQRAKCDICGAEYGDFAGVAGDIDGNEVINSDDVVQLLLHISLPDMFPITVDADFTGDGAVTSDDVVQLLLHISLPDMFPLYTTR